jgi:hypothetical protein
LSGSRCLAWRAALYRRICLMLNKNIREPRETGKVDNSSDIKQFHKVGYKDAKTWMERRLAAMKSGVSNWAATALAGEWQSSLTPDLTDLNEGIAEIESTNLARHYIRWHVPRLGQMVQQRPDSVFRFLGGQLNRSSLMEVQTPKVVELMRLINDWEVQDGGLLEVGVNWGTYPSVANLALWFRDNIPDMRTHTAHNTHEKVGHHQPGRTTTFSCRELVRYIKQRCMDHQGLGSGAPHYFIWTHTTASSWFQHTTWAVRNRVETSQSTNNKCAIFKLMESTYLNHPFSSQTLLRNCKFGNKRETACSYLLI